MPKVKKAKEIILEWYVIDTDFNQQEVTYYNIFNNCAVYDATIKLCKQYKKDKMSFEDFTEELRKIIQWQEWSRTEYECLVGIWPPQHTDEEIVKNLQKIDCYEQALPNMPIIAKYVLEKYYPKLENLSIKTVQEDRNSAISKRAYNNYNLKMPNYDYVHQYDDLISDEDENKGDN